MKLVTKLFVNTNDDLSSPPQYELIDMFDFESIELTSSIQEIRDIGSVFTDFSQEFSVPASVNNNKIFRHYYNTNLINVFDARIRKKALITINGITFREGYLRLSDVKLKNQKPYAYSVSFFGELVNLKQVLGEDELQDLNLSKYNHNYNLDNVYDGFIDGLGLVGGEMIKSSNRDIVYPAISPSDRWFYDSSAATGTDTYKQGNQVNLYTANDASLDYGIEYFKLKPAIKVKNIIDAIQDKYAFRGIVFSDDFFSNTEFNQLYLLLHNTKGGLSTVNNSEVQQVRTYPVGTSNLDSPFKVINAVGNTEVRPITVERYPDGNGLEYIVYYDLNIEITPVTPTSGVNYTVELKEFNGQTLSYDSEITGQYTKSFRLAPPFVNYYEKTWDNLQYEISTNGELSSFDVSFSIIRYVVSNGQVNQVTGDYYLVDGTQAMITELDVTKHIPKIKIYDFLKGLFNMFNLTAYVENGLIVVKTLDDFYSDGKEIDISNQVDTKDITVKRMKLFGNINFKFSEPKTFGLINQNEINQDEYGDLIFKPSNDNLIFDGDKYDIKLPFEKVFFDRLSDENTLALTDFGNGWLVDKDENETITAPVLFFNRNTSIDSSQFFGFKGKTAKLVTYNRPSNSSNNELSTINFNAENDEFSGNLIEDSLFKLNYENYIENIFDISSRMYTVSAMLNLNTLINYRMNDRFIINNNKFIINNIRTELTTGKTELELITEFSILPATSADVTPPSIPTGLTLNDVSSVAARVFWDDSTDNISVISYNVYVNNVLYENTLVTASEITGLTSATSYNVQVSALDGQNNESNKSSILTVTTL